MPKVSIILVNFNGYEDTVECVKSLQNIKYDDYEIIVVDNGSTKKTSQDNVDFLVQNTTYIQSKENLGFSGGNNIGIKHAIENGTDYTLLLNNDTTVDIDFLSVLVDAAMKEERVGIVGGKIKYYSNPKMIWFGGGGYNDENGYVWHERYNQLDEGNTGEVTEQQFITGCLMLIPVDVIRDVGMLDEKFFLYAEDTEYSCRVRRAGYKLFFCENAIIYHKVSASTGPGSFTSTYYSVRNTLYVAEEYCRSMRKCYRYYGLLWLKKILRKNIKLMPVLRGYIDYKKRIYGPYHQ